MENASKALIIAGAILLSILIIAIGMFIYNNAQSAIQGSMTQFSNSEIEAFNNNFDSYKGSATGSNVNSMITRLIANAKTYEDEPTKIPAIRYDQISAANNTSNNIIPGNAGTNNGQQSYIDSLTALKNQIENKHVYTISFSYQSNGLIDFISIGYNGIMNGSGNAHANRN